MILLEGRLACESVKNHLREITNRYISKALRPPHLAAILVGNDGGSETYVASKVKNCADVGFISSLIRFDTTVSENELLHTIHDLNKKVDVDGILVQLPLPKHINTEAIIEAIDPQKDVDGFHPYNAGKLMLGNPTFIPATPYGIMLLLEHYQIDVKGKHTVIIGRSNIVGRPLSILLSSNIEYGNATVSLCHSNTKDMDPICRQADILVAALGRPGFVHSGMVKPGAVVIDVGITRVPDSSAKKGFRIKGDVDFDDVSPACSAITPVPGGVGLMTIAGLLQNTLKAYEMQMKKSIAHE